MQRRLAGSLILGLPVLATAMSSMIRGHGLPRYLQLVNFVLAALVAFWPGGFLFLRAWQSVRTRNLNMFSLIGLGIGAAMLESAIALLRPDWFPESMLHHGEPMQYVESAVVITILVLVGQVLEIRARHRTGDAIRGLLELQPAVVRRVTPAGDEQVAIESVVPGDQLRVLPGDRVPVDCVINEGSSTIDESMLTGEPMPVEKKPGDELFGGTMNLSGSLLVAATRLGNQGTLARIVQLVAEAQRSRAPIQRYADRVSFWFVPAVVGVALIAFLAWWRFGGQEGLVRALTSSISVLVIACPCALGLATPMSIMVGMGRGARAGVLIREVEVLEILERTTIVAFDKTGTLTEGRPRLVEVRAVGGGEAELLRRVAALERHSAHPIARAILAEAERSGTVLGEATDVGAVQGGGVRGWIDGRQILAGNREFLRKAGVHGLPDESDDVDAYRAQGATIVWIAESGAYSGRMVVADTIKPTGPQVIAALHQMGIATVMLTGDHASTAASIGGKLGIETIEASLRPDDKIRRIRELRLPRSAVPVAQPQSPVVVMVGDGINDAPALAAATVGVAMGTGSDIAIEAASVSLIGGDLTGVVRAVQLSRAVMRNIRQNLVFAFSYNIIGIPLAAGALVPVTGISLHPMFAATAMMFSSLCVIGNALRLRNARIESAIH